MNMESVGVHWPKVKGEIPEKSEPNKSIEVPHDFQGNKNRVRLRFWAMPENKHDGASGPHLMEASYEMSEELGHKRWVKIPGEEDIDYGPNPEKE